MTITRPVMIEDPFPAHLSSRYLVHGRNSLAWRVEEDEECGMDWVKTRQTKNIMEFDDFTVGEGSVFGTSVCWRVVLLDVWVG